MQSLICLPLMNKIILYRLDAIVTQVDVERMLHKLRLQHVQWIRLVGASKYGDRVTISFVGTVDGQAFPGNRETDFDVVIGSRALVGDFEEQLVDLRPGDTKTVKVMFPADHANKELAGRVVDYAVTVKNVCRGVLPIIDDAFCKQVDSKGGPDTLRDEIFQTLHNQLRAKIWSDLKGQVFDALKKKSLIHPRIPENQQVAAVLRKIIEEAGIKVTNADIERRLRLMVDGHIDKEKSLHALRKNKQLIRQVRNEELENQAVRWVVNRAHVINRRVSAREVIKV